MFQYLKVSALIIDISEKKCFQFRILFFHFKFQRIYVNSSLTKSAALRTLPLRDAITSLATVAAKPIEPFIIVNINSYIYF